jgi:hypothetical protein
MLHYGMGLEEALDTRIDVAELLLRVVREEEDSRLMGLALAYHNPKALTEAVKERAQKAAQTAQTAQDAPGQAQTSAMSFAQGLAKLARLRPGSAQENEKQAKDILLKTKAAQFVAGRKGASGRKR